MNPKARRFLRTTLVVSLIVSQSACYFFRKKDTGDKLGDADGAVLGKSLGSKAGGPDYAALEDLYGITTSHAPAAIRPDPDTYVRRLLLQYNEEGSTVAQQIGTVEQYRTLLGGASQDFSKVAQDRFDATSLLANITVAESICESLVAPNAWRHPGWTSILPASPADTSTNLRFLAQRFLGKHSNDISDSKISRLETILDLEVNEGGKGLTYEAYIAPCATLALDGEALFL